jgi:hypothetical protein
MLKNLLLIHLESVGQMAFWQHSAEAETLFGLMGRSVAFSRFYTASTSSVMSVSDLLNGDSSCLDHMRKFPNRRHAVADRRENLFQALLECGYNTYGVQYGSFNTKDADNNFWGVWPDACGQFRWKRDREDMHREIRDVLEKARAARRPFALYFWNMNTHIRDEDPLKGRGLPYHERLRAGYRLLDMSVKRLLGDLADLGLLGDTLIVVFGDHGDDLWRHGLYRGRSHVVDPYANVCWCPLFMYNNDRDICISARLVSMLDLNPTLKGMLLPNPVETPATLFTGVDVARASRSVAFSQNMFALQLERSDWARALTKSYAVTDGDIRVMASCPSDLDDSGGMELYLEQWDYGSTRNMLDFCRMDASGAIAGFGSPDAVHPHFFMTMTPRNVGLLTQRYASLRDLLRAYVRKKEEEAAGSAGEQKHLFPEEMFLRARRRK